MIEMRERLRARLQGALHPQADLPEETVDSTLRALWHAAAGAPKSASAAAAAQWPDLDEAAVQHLEQLVEQRAAGTPLAHLTGRQSFMGLELLAGPEALVPRRETELLAAAAVALARQVADRGAAPRVIDVCTGAGNVAMAIASAVPTARVFAADLSPDAVDLARRNARHLNLESRVSCFAGDLLQPFDSGEYLGTIDLLTCNPPYISSARVEKMQNEALGREPRLAFDGGPFGVRVLMRLLQEGPRLLRPGGWLAFEVGLGQGAAMLKRMQDMGSFRQIVPYTDGTGATRALSGQL